MYDPWLGREREKDGGMLLPTFSLCIKSVLILLPRLARLPRLPRPQFPLA